MRSLFALAALLATTTAAAQAPEEKKDDWSGTVGAGLILLTGNSSSITSNLTASAKRQWDAWSLEAKAGGVYGRSRPTTGGDPETTALGATSSLRGDRKLGEHWSLYLLGGVDTDHVANLEYRAYGEGGTGYAWIDRKEPGDKELLLRTDLGLRYANDSRWQYYGEPPVGSGRDLGDLELIAPRLALAFRWQNTKDLVFTEDAEYLPNLKGDERFLMKSVTKLTTRVVGAVMFGVTYRVTYDSAPAPGAVKADTLLGLTLETAF